MVATGVYTNNGVTDGGVGTAAEGSSFTPKDLNDFRISAVLDRLSIHLYNNSTNDAEFENLCYSLSRGIDFSIANNGVPARSHELPSLLKKVCQTKNDTLLQAAIMVLMISVKSACQVGWFPDQDSEELSNLAKQIASKFCSASDFHAEPNPSHLVVSTVMSRFYPRLKLGHIFVFLEVKPGFDAYVSDFQISKNLKCPSGERIRLFVVQSDNIETSSCLVTPPKVNFLLNGKGVEKRINLFGDTGPQVPTVVTPLLKYGLNLLQAIGEFSGNYIIIVAVMMEVPNPDCNTLQNCEQLTPATVDADSEVIEGPSRISLNCPISFKRIKTPAKGHSCKHIQCFDFDNYVDINSRRPSWRCPHCNQHVCFSDIRIDQKMVKILKEVGPNVSDIIVSSDGSWNAVKESEDEAENREDNTLNAVLDESPQPADIMDLTQTDDLMDFINVSEVEDTKHSSQPNAQATAMSNDVNQSSTQIESDFWSGLDMSPFGVGSLNAQPNVSARPLVPTNGEVGAFYHNAVPTPPAPQTGTTPLSNPLLYQQYQLGNPPVVNDYGSLSAVPRHITRTGTAVQALPAQSPASFMQRSSANGARPFTPNGISAASQASPVPNLQANPASFMQRSSANGVSPFAPNGVSAPSQGSHTTPNLPTNRTSPHHVPPMSSSSPRLQFSMQQNRPYPSAARPPQQNNALPNMYRLSNEHQNSTQQMHMRIPRPTSQPPGAIHSNPQSLARLHSPSHAGVSQGRPMHRTASVPTTQQSHLLASANRAVQMSVGPSRTVPWNIEGHNTPTPMADQRGISPPLPRTGAQGSADPNWRPSARMRGALTGQAYDEAYNRIYNQQVQSARPMASTTPLANSGQPNLQAFMAGGHAVGIPMQNLTPTGPDILPNGSSGMH